jgi:hypothetical protein
VRRVLKINKIHLSCVICRWKSKSASVGEQKVVAIIVR